MNLCLFFEGTGQGVAGKATNVTRLHDLSVDDARQRLHLEPGPGTRFGAYLRGKIAGSDWRAIFRDARCWFEANYESLPPDDVATRVYLFGFSRGALLARHFAAWLFHCLSPRANTALADFGIESDMRECCLNARRDV